MQGKETFFKNLKHTVSDEELLSLDQNGFVHLKRDDKFWLSNGINLDIYLEKLEKIGQTDTIDVKGLTNSDLVKVEHGAHRKTNLVGEDPSFVNFLMLPDILKSVYSVMGTDFRLSSFDMRDPKSSSGWQGLHLDCRQRKNLEEPFLQTTAFVYFDDFSAKNGALRVVPGSHKEFVHVQSTSHVSEKRSLLDNHLIEKIDRERSVTLNGTRGDIVILNVNTFHGGTNNSSGENRRSLFINFRTRKLRPQLEQYDHIPKSFHDDFDEITREILHLYPLSVMQRFRRYVYHNRNRVDLKILLAARNAIMRNASKNS